MTPRALLVAPLLVLGCAGEAPSAEHVTPTVEPEASRIAETISASVTHAPAVFHLDVDGARDPFDDYFSELPPDEPAHGALARFSLDQLRLVGVMLDATPAALLEDPSGRGHIVRIGAPVGGGQLKAILKDRVLIEERMRTWSGSLVRAERVLSLREGRG